MGLEFWNLRQLWNSESSNVGVVGISHQPVERYWSIPNEKPIRFDYSNYLCDQRNTPRSRIFVPGPEVLVWWTRLALEKENSPTCVSAICQTHRLHGETKRPSDFSIAENALAVRRTCSGWRDKGKRWNHDFSFRESISLTFGPVRQVLIVLMRHLIAILLFTTMGTEV